MGLLPRSNQEHLGCVSTERPASGGLILGVQTAGSDGELVPWGVRWDGDISGLVVGGEGEMAGFGAHLSRGGALSPVDCLQRTA